MWKKKFIVLVLIPQTFFIAESINTAQFFWLKLLSSSCRNNWQFYFDLKKIVFVLSSHFGSYMICRILSLFINFESSIIIINLIFPIYRKLISQNQLMFCQKVFWRVKTFVIILLVFTPLLLFYLEVIRSISSDTRKRCEVTNFMI